MLLMDLLTREEEDIDLQTRQLRFDIGLLAERLVAATDGLRAQPGTLEQVARLARAWLARHLGQTPQETRNGTRTGE
jgi:hypothetical protein